REHRRIRKAHCNVSPLAHDARSWLVSHSPSKFSVRHDAVKQKKDSNQYQQDSTGSPPVRRQAQPEIVSDGVSEGGQQGIRSAKSAQPCGGSGNDGSSGTRFHRSPPSEGKGRIGIADRTFKSFYDGICHAQPPDQSNVPWHAQNCACSSFANTGPSSG